jgi:hypothetical protein
VVEPPLRVFGDETKFRAELRKRLRTAVDLRARLDAARDELTQMPPYDPNLKGLAAMLQSAPGTGGLTAVAESVEKWRSGNNAVMTRYLGSAGYHVSLDYAPSWHRDEERDPNRRASTCQTRIEEGVEVIERVLSRLPQAATPTTAPVEARFTEVRQCGLLDPAAFDSYVTRMSRLRTRPQISDAIGAAKEMVEACNRATCELLDLPYPEGDFGKLGKVVRKELAARDHAAPSSRAAQAIDQLFAGMASVEVALATLRNELGTGHGRRDLPRLRPRHGQLAVDTADTYGRYLVATLRDLKLL